MVFTVICRYCSQEIADGSVFCSFCGERVARKKKGKKELVKVPKPRQLKSGAWNIELRKEGVSVTEATPEACTAHARAIRGGFVKIEKTLPKQSLGVTIDNYIKDNKNLISPSTLNGYLSYRKTRFKAYMPLDVGGINWQQMINAEAENYAPKTVINAWDLVGLSLDYAKIPRPDVKLPKKRKAKRKWLDYEQIQVFCEAVKGKPYELGALLALHGLRRSEILFLSASDIDTKKEIIHIRGARVVGEGGKMVDKEDNKTPESTRTVHIVIPRLLELVEGREGRLVTTNPTTLYGSINKLCKKNGLPEVGVHGMRHSFASLAYHLKWSELTTMQEGGWDDPKIVHEIYTHLSAQDASADIDTMKAFYSGKNTNENTNAKEKTAE